MLPSDLDKLVRLMVSPLEEIDKTSKLVLSLSTGAIVLILGFLKDPTASVSARLILGASAVFFACSLFQWLTLARMSVLFQEDFAKALASDLSEYLVLLSKSETGSIASSWVKEHGTPLVHKREKLFLKFKSQCTFFVYGVLVALGYLIVLLLPVVKVAAAYFKQT